MRLLIVEDEPGLRRTLAIGLRSQGYDVLTAGDGRTALDACREDEPDLVILDLGLPDLSGMEVLARLREWSRMPVIVLSARGEPRDKVDALDQGADDYVTKPFGMEELLARIRATARRVGPEEQTVTTADFRIDLSARRATRGDDPDAEDVRLTPTEWRIIEALVRQPGVLVTQKALLQEVWGPAYSTETNYLRGYLRALRRKLEPDPAHPRYLRTEPGIGYRFEPGGSGSSTGQSGG